MAGVRRGWELAVSLLAPGSEAPAARRGCTPTPCVACVADAPFAVDGEVGVGVSELQSKG